MLKFHHLTLTRFFIVLGLIVAAVGITVLSGQENILGRNEIYPIIY